MARDKSQQGFLWEKSDLTETVRYLDTYKQHMMECFARFVINEGPGARTPVKYKNGEAVSESWQECGRRLFGSEEFHKTMKAELQKMATLQLGANEDQPPDF